MLTLPYRELPVRDPGTPDTRSPWRYLIWLARTQLGTLTAAMFFGVGWMVSQAVAPIALGKAIDQGINAHNSGALVRWSIIVFVVCMFQAVCGVYRHQLAVTNWMKGTFRSIQLVGRHLSTHASGVIESIPSGDVVNTVAADAMRIGGAFDVLARFVGAIAAWAIVAVYLLRTSTEIGLVVLIGVPVLASFTTPLMRPLHATQAAQREAAGRLAALGSDTVAGLRILRGVGGEDVFFENYAQQSQRVRFAGNRVATPQSGLESGQVLLPAILMAIVTLIGLRLIKHHQLDPGNLAAFFGLAIFLTTPLRTTIEYIIATTRAYVGARKVLAILNSDALVTDPAHPVPWPTTIGTYRDERSHVVVHSAQMTALVTETPVEAVDIADRLGHFTSDIDGASVDYIPIADFALADTRRHILVSEIEPRMFSGDLRSELSPHEHTSEADLLRALESVSGLDVIDALDGGLDTEVEERGRSFSGGQRQRLTLARALLVDAEFLILIEPTSAVDTHTESRIARGLRDARHGRTTLIATTSPLMLEQVDHVLLLDDGVVVAEGTHHELLEREPLYRRIVLRGGDE